MAPGEVARPTLGANRDDDARGALGTAGRDGGAARGPGGGAAAVPAEAAVATVRVHIHLESRPSHAHVVNVATSEVWGVTPLDVERAPANGTFTLRLSRPRFENTVVTIGADRDFAATVELRPTHVLAARAPTPPAAAPPADEPEKL